MQIAPSGYRRYAAQQRHPERQCQRRKRDVLLLAEVKRVWEQNMKVYGADKVWRQLRRERYEVARCTVERLMRRLGIQGARRGKSVRTTVADTAAPCPLDHVNRQFKADRPNQLWVSDFTYVSTWQGWLYVAFVVGKRMGNYIQDGVGGTLTVKRQWFTGVFGGIVVVTIPLMLVFY